MVVSGPFKVLRTLLFAHRSIIYSFLYHKDVDYINRKDRQSETV